jgi:hypothetical protein
MRKFIYVFLFLFVLSAHADVIDTAILTDAAIMAQNTTINIGTDITTQTRPALWSKGCSTQDGIVYCWCAYAYFDEVKDALGPGDHTLFQLVSVKTPSGWIRRWNSVNGPQAGITPWCLQ